MEFAIIAIIVIFMVVVIGGAVIVGQKRNKELLAAGKIIKRQPGFWENAEVFKTDSNFDSVINCVKSTDFSDCKVTIDYDITNQFVLFKSSYAWNAIIEYQGKQENKNVYKFSFPAWKTKNNFPNGVDKMNIIETAVEKIFLSLDAQTTVETHRMKYKTKI